jgi:histidinol dehydrogenase
VGPAASVAFGDYMTGANHVLPTAGRARSFSGLSTSHYLRSYTIQEIDAAGAASMAGDVAILAEAEGLPAHAAAAKAAGALATGT